MLFKFTHAASVIPANAGIPSNYRANFGIEHRCRPIQKIVNYIQQFSMSKEQIKSEINKVLDQFSDKGLEEILNLLKKLDAQSLTKQPDLLQKILSEDSRLLERLAR